MSKLCDELAYVKFFTCDDYFFLSYCVAAMIKLLHVIR